MNPLKTSLYRLLLSSSLLWLSLSADAASQRVKDLVRFDGWRDNQLVGYGLVTGLAGTGDSQRSRATQQSIANLLNRFDLRIEGPQLNSRNVAAVMVTATLPPLAEPGAPLDVTVTSIGDARSLVGGSLLQTPLKGADERVYVLAQGAISVGGYRYESNGNLVQKNHPTVGKVPSGGIVEQAVASQIVKDGSVTLLLNAPDYTTANRIVSAINRSLPGHPATPLSASRIGVKIDNSEPLALSALLTRIEALEVAADDRARVVINERTGTVVAGGGASLSAVTVVHGDLKVSISTEFQVSQPGSGLIAAPGVRTAVVPQTQINVSETASRGLNLKSGATIADLVAALNKIHASPRDVIAVLQAIRTAGALHAELIIQ
ncbi:flagellar basal body P-ring protein FlgI [Neisseriaceae bacterium TC5R-5]|nr:flagellar basal body P-ring protein FlgI [Neisseriaceae bacterium TC5R-5]